MKDYLLKMDIDTLVKKKLQQLLKRTR